MLQRNAGSQSQMGMAGQGRLENQMNGMLAAARALAGSPAEPVGADTDTGVAACLQRRRADQQRRALPGGAGSPGLR